MIGLILPGIGLPPVIQTFDTPHSSTVSGNAEVTLLRQRSVPSNTASPVVFVKLARTIVSFSVSPRVNAVRYGGYGGKFMRGRRSMKHRLAATGAIQGAKRGLALPCRVAPLPMFGTSWLGNAVIENWLRLHCQSDENISYRHWVS